MRIGFLPNKNDCTRAHARINEGVFCDKKNEVKKKKKEKKERKRGDTKILIIIADCLSKALPK